MFKRAMLAAVAALSISAPVRAEIIELSTTFLDQDLPVQTVHFACMDRDQVPARFFTEDFSVMQDAMAPETGGSHLARTGANSIVLVDSSCFAGVRESYFSHGLPRGTLLIAVR